MTRVWPVLALGLLAGCTSAPVERVTFVSPSLVMPSLTLQQLSGPEPWPADQRAWEFGRNDVGAGAASTPAYAPFEVVEIRTHDRRRTSDGRPREFSTTRTRTIRSRIRQ
ncbi:MAG: hypothetical protein ACYSXF_11135 [Planctomycetota bacterium]|jgi:hypothetical protein